MGLAAVLICLHPGSMVAVEAQGNVPPGFLPPGSYPVRVLGADAGHKAARQSSLVVTTEDGYRQTLNLPFDLIELKLRSSGSLDPAQILLEELSINGFRFLAEPPVVYRPLDVHGVLIPLQPWEWTLASEAGGATLTQYSIIQLPEVELRGLVPTLVQRVDSTLEFGGAASGTIRLTQWEAVGDPGYMRQRAEGSVSVGGNQYPIDVAVFLGHSGYTVDL